MSKKENRRRIELVSRVKAVCIPVAKTSRNNRAVTLLHGPSLRFVISDDRGNVFFLDEAGLDAPPLHARSIEFLERLATARWAPARKMSPLELLAKALED